MFIFDLGYEILLIIINLEFWNFGILVNILVYL